VCCITAYSFSGIGIDCIGDGRDQADLCASLAGQYLVFDDSFFVKALVDKAVAEIPDELILSNCGR
jgi:hypothetical protein